MLRRAMRPYHHGFPLFMRCAEIAASAAYRHRQLQRRVAYYTNDAIFYA